MYAPIREGNRGGRGLFSWEDVRGMPYRDRECYLGSTSSLGFLDKGGRWRKRDWWIKNGKTEDQEVRNVGEVRNQDLDNIRAALGIVDVKKSKKEKKGLSDKEKEELLKKRPRNVADVVRTAGLGYVAGKVESEEEVLKEEVQERKSLYKTYKRHKKSRKEKF